MNYYLCSEGNNPRPIGELLIEFLHSEEPLAIAIRRGLEEFGTSPDSTTALEDWLTGDVVQDMLDISERTLQTWRSTGIMPYAKLGNKVYYKRSDVERLLDSAYNKKK